MSWKVRNTSNGWIYNCDSQDHAERFARQMGRQQGVQHDVIESNITLLDAAVGINEATKAAEEMTAGTGRYHYADYSDLDNVMAIIDTGFASEDEFYAAAAA